MISDPQRRLNALWWQPGAWMAPAWWPQLALSAWQDLYPVRPRLRPAIDRLIATRLGHHGAPPAADALSMVLLADTPRAQQWCLALGLWALQCPDYLLLARFRQTLSPPLSPTQVTQLACLFPVDAQRTPTVQPEALPALALAAGAAWLGQSGQPALALCRLRWPPSQLSAPAARPDEVLEKLKKWI